MNIMKVSSSTVRCIGRRMMTCPARAGGGCRARGVGLSVPGRYRRIIMLPLILVLVVIVSGVKPHDLYCTAMGTFIERYVQPFSQFCTAVSDAENSLLQQDGLPRFQSFDASHVAPGMQKLVRDFEKGIGDIEQTYKGYTVSDLTWAKVSDPLERLGAPLEFGWGMVSHLNGVRNSPQLREAHQDAQPAVVMVSSRLSQSQVIYNAMKGLSDRADSLTFDLAQRRILEAAVREARHGGAELTGKDKDRFNEIKLQLAKLSSDFSNNVLDGTKAYTLDLKEEGDVQGLPASLRQLMAAAAAAPDAQQINPEKGPWRLTLDLPCFEPFMKHSTRSDLRETVYKAYITRASSGSQDNSGIIEEIRRLRKEISVLLGYQDFAALSLESKMAGQAGKVWELIHSLRDKSKEAARRELAQLQSFATAEGFSGDLRHWDIPFWSERQREHLFSFNDEDLRPFFPLPTVLQGLFNLTSFLFSVSIQSADDGVDKWHEDVQFYKIFDKQGEHIASFYLDPYSRPSEKRGGAWMGQCQGKSELLGTKPVAYLICNQTPPQKDKPSLMTFREVQTLFHEFGHGLQHMLTRVPYAAAAGINNVEWDAVELPSQFMENWLYDPDTIGVVSSHHQTGARLPEPLFQQVLKARKYRAGSAMLRQLYFAALDLELHTSDDPWPEIMSRISDEYTIMKPLKEDHFPCSFQHIFASGYAAGYYSYKWAEVMAADAFSAFEDVGLSNRPEIAKVGLRFRDTVLGMGGGNHPSAVFREFRGRDPEVEPLLKTFGLS